MFHHLFCTGECPEGCPLGSAGQSCREGARRPREGWCWRGGDTAAGAAPYPSHASNLGTFRLNIFIVHFKV